MAKQAATKTKAKSGKILQVIGSVLDISFDAGELPDIYTALEIDVPGPDGKKETLTA